MYREGGIIGKSNTPSLTSASGTWRINEINNAEQTNTFPVYVPVSTTASLNTITNVPINIEFGTAAADSPRAFDVVDVYFTSGSTAGHTFYIECVPRGPTTYYNDLCIGAFQVLKASNEVITVAKGAGNAGAYSSLQTTTMSFNPVLVPTHTAFGGSTFQAVTTGSTNARWNVASSTGSYRTGAVDGLYYGYSVGLNKLPSPGIGAVSQNTSQNYIYLETSINGVIDMGHWLKNNETNNLETNTDYIFRIAYHFNTSTGQYATTNNIMYVFIEN